MAIGAYEKFKNERLGIWKRLVRSGWGTAEHATLTQLSVQLLVRRDQYLRELLARLPFRWHVAHAYTPRETATHGGADHIVVNEEVRFGRLVRQPGDALSRAATKFWGLASATDARLPTSLADIKIAERIVMSLQTP